MEHPVDPSEVTSTPDLVKTAEALSQLADLLEHEGPGSANVLKFCEDHVHLPQFQELAEESLRLEQQCHRKELAVVSPSGARSMTAPGPKFFWQFAGLAASVFVVVLALGVFGSLRNAKTELESLTEANETLTAKKHALEQESGQLAAQNVTLVNKNKLLKVLNQAERDAKVDTALFSLERDYRLTELRSEMQDPAIAEKLRLVDPSGTEDLLVLNAGAFTDRLTALQDSQKAALALRAFKNAGQRSDDQAQLLTLIQHVERVQAAFSDDDEVRDQAKDVAVTLRQLIK